MKISNIHPDFVIWQEFIQSTQQQYPQTTYNKKTYTVECYVFYIKWSNNIFYVGNKIDNKTYINSDINKAIQRFNKLIQNY